MRVFRGRKSIQVQSRTAHRCVPSGVVVSVMVLQAEAPRFESSVVVFVLLVYKKFVCAWAASIHHFFLFLTANLSKEVLLLYVFKGLCALMKGEDKMCKT